MNATKKQVTMQQWFAILEEFLDRRMIDEMQDKLVELYGLGFNVAVAVYTVKKEHPSFKPIEV